MINHEMVEFVDNSISIRLLDGVFNGLVFSYGAVKFLDNNFGDSITLQFDYDIHEYPFGMNETNIDNDKLKHVLGDLLQDLIKQQLSNNELVFTGGTDEPNRENDTF